MKIEHTFSFWPHSGFSVGEMNYGMFNFLIDLI
jgi:hypothetical protein